MTYGRRTLAVLVLIGAVVAACYYGTVSGPFVYDDLPQIVDNPQIRSVSGIPGLFAKGVWEDTARQEKLYRPLAFAGWSIEYALAGTDPRLYHLTNIFLHILCSFLVFLVISELAGDEKASLAGALLFAAHPAHTEAVSWISCRMELMYTFFSLIVLWLYIRRPRAGIAVYAGAAIYFLALLSKEAAVALPGVFALHTLLFDTGGVRERIRAAAVRLYPFVAATAAYLLLRLYVLGSVGAGAEASVFYGVPGINVFLTMCKALTHYVRIMFLPFNLTVDYVFPPVDSIYNIETIIGAAVLVGIVATWRTLADWSKPAAFGAGMFVVMLAPVSNIVPLPNIMSERALYMPSVGFSILAAALLTGVRGRAGISAQLHRKAAYALVAAVIVMFALLAHERNKFWYDADAFARGEQKMYESKIRLFPDYPPYYRMYLESAAVTKDLGDSSRGIAVTALERFDEPGIYSAVAGLSRVSKEVGGQAIELPDGLAPEKYARAAEAYSEQGLTGESLGLIERAVALEPRNPHHYITWGSVLVRTGNMREALEMFRKGAALAPSDADVFIRAGTLLGSAEEFGQAAAYLERAVALAPESADAHCYLGIAYLGLGRKGSAVKELERALKIAPAHELAARALEDAG